MPDPPLLLQRRGGRHFTTTSPAMVLSMSARFLISGFKSNKTLSILVCAGTRRDLEITLEKNHCAKKK
jgi:hypothetical protein